MILIHLNHFNQFSLCHLIPIDMWKNHWHFIWTSDLFRPRLTINASYCFLAQAVISERPCLTAFPPPLCSACSCLTIWNPAKWSLRPGATPFTIGTDALCVVRIDFEPIWFPGDNVFLFVFACAGSQQRLQGSGRNDQLSEACLWLRHCHSVCSEAICAY